MKRTYENRLDDIVTHAWERWTNNGLGLNDDDKLQTGKSVRDAAVSAYHPRITDLEWAKRTLERLDGGVS